MNISFREIYDSLQVIGSDVKELQVQVRSIEKQGEEIKELQKQVDSIEDKADKALELATKHDTNIGWLWKTIIGACITALVGGAITLFFLLLQNQLTPVPANKTEITVPADDAKTSSSSTNDKEETK